MIFNMACGGGKPRITYTGAYTAQSYTADGKPYTLYTLTGSGTLTVRGRARHAGVWLCGGGANGMTGGSDENRPANFGKGELEGIAAAESGNNGVCGATLIPLLSLGVPGDIVTAVMLGAFMMHNITPGPLLFEENLPLVYALYFGIILSSLFLLISGFFCLRGADKITRAPRMVLFPAILCICLFGAFSINNNAFDILVLLCMGLVSMYMGKNHIAEAPFLVAFILGPLFEDNLRRSLLISHGDVGILWSTPICWFFIALTALSLFITLRKEWLERKKSPDPVEPPNEE